MSPSVDAELFLATHSALDAGRPNDDARRAHELRIRIMVEQHFDVVWRSLRRLGVSPAAVDDAAQQVFLTATRKLDIIRPGGERAYLLGIAVRVASDTRRALSRLREVAEEDGGDASAREAASRPSIEELVDRKRARELLDAVLATMPPELRTAFVLFELEDIAVPEIAAVLAIPVGTVASRIRRAREVFQKRVREFTRPKGGGAR
jgi:RNA polymerase sigma-70 factor (ECF subfamily)